MVRFIAFICTVVYTVWTDRTRRRFWVKDNLSNGLEIYGYLRLEGKVTNKYKYFRHGYNTICNIYWNLNSSTRINNFYFKFVLAVLIFPFVFMSISC